LTVKVEQTAVPRRWWRRASVWLVIAGIVVVVLVAVLIGAFVVNGGQRNSSRTPRALLVETLGWVQETAVVAGGHWTFPDKSIWNAGDTSGYTGEPCGDNSAAQQYNIDVVSSGVSNPVAAASAMVEHWKGLGYTVRHVGVTNHSNGDYTEIAVDFGGGAGLGYTVSTSISAIDASSECSSDPAMLDTTK
jgi:hypothetical protein